MDLKNLHQHKRNTKAAAGDTVYNIDGDGIVHDIHPDHARELLVDSSSWQVLRAPAAAPVAIPAEKPQEPAKPQEQPEKKPEAAPEPRKPAEPASELLPPPAPPAETKSDAQVAAEEGIPPGEWPDPDETMEMSYLRQMADAYEVKYTVKTSKKTLIKDIKAAMYGEEG